MDKILIESGRASGEFTVKPYTYGVYKAFSAATGLPTAKQLFEKVKENNKVVEEKVFASAKAGKVRQVKPQEFDEDGKLVDAGIEINAEMMELGQQQRAVETEILNFDFSEALYIHIPLILEEDSSAIDWNDCDPKGANDAVSFFIDKAIKHYQK